MAKPLSEQLSEIAVHAKKAEDMIAAAQKETRDKVVARREQARAAAQAAVDKMHREFKSIGDSAARSWKALQTKIAADIDALKANVGDRKAVGRAEDHAGTLEREAAFAIDYAIASIEQAKIAALDAVIGRMETRQAR